jgi:hypothetical protein
LCLSSRSLDQEVYLLVSNATCKELLTCSRSDLEVQVRPSGLGLAYRSRFDLQVRRVVTLVSLSLSHSLSFYKYTYAKKGKK